MTVEKIMIHQDVKPERAIGTCLFIGQDRRGGWVVKDPRRRCGGWFANRTEAIRFAMYECRRRPQSVIMLPEPLEFDGPLVEQHLSDPSKPRAA
jgi:hypothetical protein